MGQVWWDWNYSWIRQAQPEHMKVKRLSIQVFPNNTPQKFLGSAFIFHQAAQTQVESQIAAAWAISLC